MFSASKSKMEMIKCMADPMYYIDNYGYCFNADTSKLDKIDAYNYQREAIQNFEEHKNNIILKSRQCIPEGTFVNTPNGPKAIENFEIGDSVYSYNFEKNIVEEDKVYDAWNSGKRDCVRIKLKDSRNVEVGKNHPFYVEEKGWIKAKDLQIGDLIKDNNIHFGNIKPNNGEEEVLAYLLTDGSTLKQVKFTNNNKYYLQDFKNSVSKLFPKISFREQKKLNGYDIFPSYGRRGNNKNPLMEWCKEKGIKNKKTIDKLIPEEVFNWNKYSVSLFLNRCFAADGWISILRRNSNKRLELGFAAPSKEFLEQIRMLLKKFNIKSNIYEIFNMKLQQNRFFKLRITHSKSIVRFLNEIGIYNKITNEHIEICNNYKHDVRDVSEVRKKEFTDKKNCYDISVTKNENFHLDGLLVHNTGMSVISAAYIAWTALFRSDQRILIVANDLNSAQRLLKTVKDFVSHTPSFLVPKFEKNNEKYIEFSNGSWVKAVASSRQAGRGEALTLLVIDEVAFIENAEDIKAGALMAVSRTGGKTFMISCVPKDTYVFTNKGLKTVGQFVDNKKEGGYQVDPYKVFGKDKLRKGNLFFNNGYHTVKKN